MRKKRNIVFSIVFVSVFFLCVGNVMGYTVNEVVFDLLGPEFRDDQYFQEPWGKHEGLLHGVPLDWDWASGARPGIWIDYSENKAISMWGQAYEWAEGSPVKNIRIHIRNMKLYALTNNGWQLLAHGSDWFEFDEAKKKDGYIQGSNWKEDFSESKWEPIIEVRTEETGGTSFTMEQGWNFHWWIPKWPRNEIPEGSIAFYITCEGRLIPDDDPDVDLDQAKYLMGVSADYYPGTEDYGPGPWPSLCISRHKFIKPEWQTFTSYIGGEVPTSVEEYRNFILEHPLPPGVTKE